MKRPVCIGQPLVSQCLDCHVPLRKDEIAITRRMIGRGVTQYLCIKCLALRLQISPDAIKEKIKDYKALGCVLFR